MLNQSINKFYHGFESHSFQKLYTFKKKQIMLIQYILILIKILIIIVPLLISVAYFTLAERKILGAIQRRRGPNVIGAFGLLQPLSDGFKLLIKETVMPSSSNKFIFILSPIITFVISLIGWSLIPYSKYAILSEVNVGILYLFAIKSVEGCPVIDLCPLCIETTITSFFQCSSNLSNKSNSKESSASINKYLSIQ